MSKNWELTTLGKAYDVRDGTHDSPKYHDTGYPLITSKNLKNGSLTYTKIKYISEMDYQNINKRSKVDIGDILFAMIGTIGNPVVIKEEPKFAIKNVALFKVDVLNDSSFLKYYLESEYVVNRMRKEAKGTTQKFVGLGYLRNFPILLPQKEEQKQIVQILDKTFESIEQSKVNIEKNIENIKELFESRLTEIFSQKGDDWEDKKLEELSNKKKAIVSGPFGSNLKVADYRDSGVPILRLQNVGKGYFIEKDIKYIEKEKAEELKSHSYVVGDIVLAKLGIPIGKTCIIPDTFNDGIILADIVRIRPDKKIVNYKYLEYFLNTELSVSQLTKEISGATRPRVNLSNVRSIIVPIPSLKTQNKLIIEIDKLSEETNQLEKQYQQKLKNLEELKKSILEKAFSGELLK